MIIEREQDVTAAALEAMQRTADPRMRVFEEFEEEKYQSIVSVPLLAKDASVLGVVALHAEAPHDYTERDAEFLLTSASLVAGASFQ